MTDSKTKICKAMARKVLGQGKKYGTGLWDECETLKLGDKSEPDGIP